MSKTGQIQLACDGVRMEPRSVHNLTVILENPDTDHVLDEIHRDDLATWLQDNKSPDDVFTDKQLQQWAEDNGYVKQ